MAYFRLRSDALSWFSEVRRSPLMKVQFDLYYFCLMTGFANQRSSETGLAGASASDLVEDFTADYKPSQLLLIGLLVVAELKNERIDVHEADAVRGTFKRLVDPSNRSQLTDYGVRRMNAYASGGYEYLSEVRDTKPYSAEEFLRDFVALVRAPLEAPATGS